MSSFLSAEAKSKRKKSKLNVKRRGVKLYTSGVFEARMVQKLREKSSFTKDNAIRMKQFISVVENTEKRNIYKNISEAFGLNNFGSKSKDLKERYIMAWLKAWLKEYKGVLRTRYNFEMPKYTGFVPKRRPGASASASGASASASGASASASGASASASGALFDIIRQQDMTALRVAITPANVNSRDVNGTTLLHAAAMTGNMEIAELLLDRGADPTAQDTLGRTPFDVAVDTKISPSVPNGNSEELEEALKKIRAMELEIKKAKAAMKKSELDLAQARDANEQECPICFENMRGDVAKVVFQCGHVVCAECAATLTQCPVCRETIQTRIPLYLKLLSKDQLQF